MSNSHSVPFFQDPDFWRPQTYLMFAALISLAFASASPMFQIQLGAEATGVVTANALKWYQESVCTQYVRSGTITLPVFAITTVIMMELVVVILMYKRRLVQSLLLLSTSLAFILVGGISFILTQGELQKAQQDAACEATITLSWGSAFLVLGSLLCIVAAARVRADEKRLKQSERFW